MERRAASGDLEAGAHVWIERLRAGELGESSLRLAAYLQLPFAAHACERFAEEPSPVAPGARVGWLSRIQEWGREPIDRAALAIAYDWRSRASAWQGEVFLAERHHERLQLMSRSIEAAEDCVMSPRSKKARLRARRTARALGVTAWKRQRQRLLRDPTIYVGLAAGAPDAGSATRHLLRQFRVATRLGQSREQLYLMVRAELGSWLLGVHDSVQARVASRPPGGPSPRYSWRRATIGSRRAARRAGK